jgi:hypothetical protein
MNKEIVELIRNLKSAEIAEQYLSRLLHANEYNAKKKNYLEKLIKKKFKKIDSLTSISVKSLYYKLLKTKTQQLEIEKQRYFEISLEYNEILKTIENNNYEIDVLGRKVESIDSLRKELRSKVSNLSPKWDNQSTKLFKKIIEQNKSNIALIKEFEEAIDLGVIVNKKLNKILKFIKDKAQSIYNEFEDKSIINDFQVNQIDKYQDLMVSLKHSLLKFDLEIEEVYQIILNDKSYKNSKSSILIDDYKEHLVSDVFNTNTLGSSFLFIKSLKTQVMGLTKVLRSDLRKLKKQQIELENRELQILELIKKYAM